MRVVICGRRRDVDRTPPNSSVGAASDVNSSWKRTEGLRGGGQGRRLYGDRLVAVLARCEGADGDSGFTLPCQ